MRNAVVSIESNIAEGCGRGTQAELSRFLQIARGSASELECQLLIARDLSLLSPELYLRLCSGILEIERMLSALREKTR
jgi:four helix bundle protein